MPYDGLGDTVAAPFAPATVRIEFINRVLPSDNLIRKPKPAVRADIRASGEAPGFRHSVQRGARNRDQRQNLRLVQHASRPGFIRCYLFRFGLRLSRCDHRNFPRRAGAAGCSGMLRHGRQSFALHQKI
jgi:hypothetical protein